MPRPWPHDCGGDRERTGISFDVPHEAAVDLQLADRQVRQPAQDGIAGAAPRLR
jgi:hypothetical protein